MDSLRPLSRWLLGALCIASAAGAEDPSSQLPPDDIEQITVTGQRSENDSQSQAIAISSFSQEQLDQLGVTRLSDLQASVPSLHISQSGTATIVTLRGVGTENTNLSGEPGVLFIVDGVPISDLGAIDGAFFDIATVQVSRGPQGTQGHKNAAGGWIEVNSVPPQADLSAQADYQIGTYDQHVARWALNLPLVGEKLMARISGRFEDRDGYQRAMRFYDPIRTFELAPIVARRSDDFGSAHDLATRFQLRSLAVAGLDVRLIGTYAFQRGNAPAPHLLSEPGVASLRSGRFEPRFPGLLPRTSDDPNWSRTNLSSPEDGRTASATLFAVQDVQGTLFGDLQIEGTFGYFRADREIAFDLDATERDAQVIYHQTVTSQYSGEVKLQTVGGRPWDWMLGAFYLQEKREKFGALLTRPFFRRRSHQEIENGSLAGFFELSYWLTERFRLVLGARLSEDVRLVSELRRGIDVDHPSIPPSVGRPRRSRTGSVNGRFVSFTPKLQFQWQWSDGSHVSLGATKGSKAGGFPLGVLCSGLVDCPSYASEELWQYQFISKNDFFDERLRLNLTLFWTDYDPYQVCFGSGLESRCNTGGSATTRGVEVEIMAYPVPELALNLNFNLLDARIDDFRIVDPFHPRYFLGVRPATRNPLFGFAQDLSGNTMNKAPRYNLSLGAQYDVHARTVGLPDWGTITPRIQYQYQSRTFYRPWNRPEFSQQPFSRVDVRLGWRSRSGRWSLEGFVDNVTDVDVINYLQVGAFADGTVFSFYHPPRTAGIRVGMAY